MSHTLVKWIGSLLVLQLPIYNVFGSQECEQIADNSLSPSDCADSYILKMTPNPPGAVFQESLDFHTYLQTKVADPNTPDGNNWYKYWEDEKGSIDIKYCNAIIPIMDKLSDSCLCEMKDVCNDICNNDIFNIFAKTTQKLLLVPIDREQSKITTKDCQNVLPQIESYEKSCGNTNNYQAIQQCANDPNATPNPTASTNTPQPTSTASPTTSITSTLTTSASINAAEDTSTSTTTTTTTNIPQSDESTTSTPQTTGSQDTDISTTTTVESTSSDTDTNEPTSSSITAEIDDVSTTDIWTYGNYDNYVYLDSKDGYINEAATTLSVLDSKEGADINNTSFGNTQIKEIIINHSNDIKVLNVLIAVIIVLFVMMINIIICWKCQKPTNKHQRLDDQQQDETAEVVVSEIELDQQYNITNNKDKTVTSYVHLGIDNKIEGEGSMITTALV